MIPATCVPCRAAGPITSPEPRDGRARGLNSVSSPKRNWPSYASKPSASFAESRPAAENWRNARLASVSAALPGAKARTASGVTGSVFIACRSVAVERARAPASPRICITVCETSMAFSPYASVTERHVAESGRARRPAAGWPRQAA